MKFLGIEADTIYLSNKAWGWGQRLILPFVPTRTAVSDDGVTKMKRWRGVWYVVDFQINKENPESSLLTEEKDE